MQHCRPCSVNLYHWVMPWLSHLYICATSEHLTRSNALVWQQYGCNGGNGCQMGTAYNYTISDGDHLRHELDGLCMFVLFIKWFWYSEAQCWETFLDSLTASYGLMKLVLCYILYKKMFCGRRQIPKNQLHVRAIMASLLHKLQLLNLAGLQGLRKPAVQQINV